MIKETFYKIRLSLLMYGLAWLIRVAAIVNKDFRGKLSQKDISFIMSSREGSISRYYRIKGGRLQTGRGRPATDFGLIWQDNRSGGKVMQDIVLGKGKALYKSVMSGVLTLEGEGAAVTVFMGIMNQLNRVFGPRKKAKASGKT